MTSTQRWRGAVIAACWMAAMAGVRGQDVPDKLTLTNSLKMRLVWIPAGEFQMGAEEDREATLDFFPYYEPKRLNGEQPRHTVRITKPFYLGQHEVTLGQFMRFCRAAKYKTEIENARAPSRGYDKSGRLIESRQFRPWAPGWKIEMNHPVVYVSWKDATAFCDWLSQKEGKTYRLPTEAEWEYACRAGTSSRYSFGNNPEELVFFGNGADQDRRAGGAVGYLTFIDRDANKIESRTPFPFLAGRDGYAWTAPVGTFRPNAWGLYDMHGNVWEWCVDWFDENYYEGSPTQDPQGPPTGSSHVVRGGSFDYCPVNLRCAYRGNVDTEYRYFTPIGFRVVCEP